MSVKYSFKNSIIVYFTILLIISLIGFFTNVTGKSEDMLLGIIICSVVSAIALFGIIGNIIRIKYINYYNLTIVGFFGLCLLISFIASFMGSIAFEVTFIGTFFVAIHIFIIYMYIREKAKKQQDK